MQKRKFNPDIANKPLTMRQEKFVRFYIENGGNGEKAAIDAGYERRSAIVIAAENLTKPNIAQKLNSLKEKILLPIEERTGLTLEYKMNSIVKGIEACLSGEAKGNGKVDAKGLASLIAEANKMQGHYAPEKHVNANVTSTVDQEVMSDLIKKYTKEY
jgi:hypothetical protein